MSWVISGLLLLLEKLGSEESEREKHSENKLDHYISTKYKAVNNFTN
jgi:hypothetical protein